MMEEGKKQTCRITVRVNKQQVGADFFLSVARWRGTESNELGMLESKAYDSRCKQEYVALGNYRRLYEHVQSSNLTSELHFRLQQFTRQFTAQ
jgi:hypothetical protein